MKRLRTRLLSIIVAQTCVLATACSVQSLDQHDALAPAFAISPETAVAAVSTGPSLQVRAEESTGPEVSSQAQSAPWIDRNSVDPRCFNPGIEDGSDVVACPAGPLLITTQSEDIAAMSMADSVAHAGPRLAVGRGNHEFSLASSF